MWLLDFGHGSRVIYFNYEEGGSWQAGSSKCIWLRRATKQMTSLLCIFLSQGIYLQLNYTLTIDRTFRHWSVVYIVGLTQILKESNTKFPGCRYGWDVLRGIQSRQNLGQVGSRWDEKISLILKFCQVHWKQSRVGKFLSENGESQGKYLLFETFSLN